jgi:hypothetical protein
MLRSWLKLVPGKKYSRATQLRGREGARCIKQKGAGRKYYTAYRDWIICRRALLRMVQVHVARPTDCVLDDGLYPIETIRFSSDLGGELPTESARNIVRIASSRKSANSCPSTNLYGCRRISASRATKRRTRWRSVGQGRSTTIARTSLRTALCGSRKISSMISARTKTNWPYGGSSKQNRPNFLTAIWP